MWYSWLICAPQYSIMQLSNLWCSGYRSKKLSRLHKTFYLFRRPPYPHAAVNNMQSKTADFASGAAIWRTGRNIRVVSDSGPFGQLRENMTSSTKPKMNDQLHCLLRRIETRHAQVTCTENLVNIGRVIFEICERTETQTDRQTRWSECFTQLQGAKLQVVERLPCLSLALLPSIVPVNAYSSSWLLVAACSKILVGPKY